MKLMKDKLGHEPDRSKRSRLTQEIEVEIDRLSELPTPVLFQILNLLHIKEAAKTSLLSKRWRFLWANSSFRLRTNETEVCRGPALDTFYLSSCNSKTLTSWLDFAAQNNSKNLSLNLQHNYTTCAPPYKYTLPHTVYSISSLTELHLHRCVVVSPVKVDWRSLKTLSLLSVKLPQQAIAEIGSNCALLQSLRLVACTGFNRVEIGGRSFRRLHVEYNDERLLEISAPCMRELTMAVNLGDKVRVQNAAVSLERANIIFVVRGWSSVSEETMRDNTMELFQDLCHVKDLKLSRTCTKVISIMAMKGWQLPQLRVEDLHIKLARDEYSTYGAVAILESSPCLKTLLICGYDFQEEFINLGPITRGDLNCHLLHLKTVDFKPIFSQCSSEEPILQLARALLKKSPVLEKMVIHETRLFSKIQCDSMKTQLWNHPRSSQKASIVSK